jgi:hypothetical protein
MYLTIPRQVFGGSVVRAGPLLGKLQLLTVVSVPYQVGAQVGGIIRIGNVDVYSLGIRMHPASSQGGDVLGVIGVEPAGELEREAFVGDLDVGLLVVHIAIGDVDGIAGKRLVAEGGDVVGGLAVPPKWPPLEATRTVVGASLNVDNLSLLREPAKTGTCGAQNSWGGQVRQKTQQIALNCE